MKHYYLLPGKANPSVDKVYEIEYPKPFAGV